MSVSYMIQKGEPEAR